MLQITKKQLEDLYLEGGVEIDGKEIEVIEEGEWEQDHKYQSLELIFTDGKKNYRGYISRSGSPFTDWTYDSELYGADDIEDIDEVVQKAVTVTRWVAV